VAWDPIFCFKIFVNFHSRGINARMPIQSSQVRRGTLISLPFFSFFVVVFVVTIFKMFGPKLTRPSPAATRDSAQHLPFQSAEGLFVELENAQQSQAFHPKTSLPTPWRATTS